MGVEEEAGKVADSFISALKGQPLSLALVFMNVALLIMVGYISGDLSDNRKRMAELVFKLASETQVILSKCVDVEEIRRMLAR